MADWEHLPTAKALNHSIAEDAQNRLIEAEMKDITKILLCYINIPRFHHNGRFCASIDVATFMKESVKRVIYMLESNPNYYSVDFTNNILTVSSCPQQDN